MTDHDRATCRFLFETGHLKRTARAGWVYAGVPAGDVESVAEHSHNAAVIAYALAVLEGANPERAAVMALFHDTQETRISDIPYVGKRYLSATDNRTVTAHQTEGLPETLGDAIREVVDEYEGRESIEARLARDADKLECVIQAIDYRSRGMGDVQDWIDSCTAKLESASAKRMAHEAASMSAHDWWRHVLNQDT